MNREEVLNLALESDLVAFSSEALNHEIFCITNSSAFFYLVAAYHRNPTNDIVKAKVLQYLKEFTTAG
jgi:hypothetical protein